MLLFSLIILSVYRFGPGLVIYWFGYVEGLENIHQDRTILIRDELPKNLVFLDPSTLTIHERYQ